MNKKLLVLFFTFLSFCGLGLTDSDSLAFGSVATGSYAFLLETFNYEDGTFVVYNKLDVDVLLSDATTNTCTGASDARAIVLPAGAIWTAEKKRTGKERYSYWCVKALSATSSGTIYATTTD